MDSSVGGEIVLKAKWKGKMFEEQQTKKPHTKHSTPDTSLQFSQSSNEPKAKKKIIHYYRHKPGYLKLRHNRVNKQQLSHDNTCIAVRDTKTSILPHNQITRENFLTEEQTQQKIYTKTTYYQIIPLHDLGSFTFYKQTISRNTRSTINLSVGKLADQQPVERAIFAQP